MRQVLQMAVLIAALTVPQVARGGENETEAQAARLLEAFRKAETWEEKEQILFDLGDLGPEARVAIPALVELLGSNEPTGFIDCVGEITARTLGYIGPESIPALRAALENRDPAIRQRAVKALSQLGRDGRAVVPDLIAMLDKPDAVVGESDCSISSGIHPEIAIALGAIGERPDIAVPALTKLLMRDEKNADGEVPLFPPVALASVQALGQFGPRASDAVPPLMDICRGHPATAVRAEALHSLVRIGGGDREIVLVLAESLNDATIVPSLALVGGLSIQQHAARELEGLHGQAAPALGAVIDLLKAPETRTKPYGTLTRILVQIGPGSEKAIPILKEDVKRPLSKSEWTEKYSGIPETYDSQFVRVHAAWALTRLDPTDESAVDALKHVLSDRSWARMPYILLAGRPADPRDAAVRDLHRMTDRAKNSLMPVLDALIKDEEEVERASDEPKRELALLDPSGLPQLPRLLLASDDLKWEVVRLKDDDPRWVSGLIGRIRSQERWETPQGLARLIAGHRENAAKHVDDVVTNAVYARNSIDADYWLSVLDQLDDDLVTPAIHKLFRANEPAEGDQSGCFSIIEPEGLARLGSRVDGAVTDLLRLLRSPNHCERAGAALILGRTRQRAPDAVAALVECFNDKRALVRMRAAAALGELGVRDPKVIAALEKAKLDDYYCVRGAAAQALDDLKADRP